jgi:hypothetical protein
VCLVAELHARKDFAPPLLQKVRKQLQKQREKFLAFAADLDRDLAALAADLEIPVGLARTMLQVQGLDPGCQISSRSEPFFSQPSATTEVVDCNDCVIEWP